MIGEVIRSLRIEKGLTQSELAAKISSTQKQISKWEIGFLEPNIEAIKKLAIFFDVTSDYLIGLENDAGVKVKEEIVFEKLTYKKSKKD